MTPRPRTFRSILIGAAALVGAAVLSLAAPLAAQAHVSVAPGQAAAGSYATLTFKVPNESATAGTVKVEIDLPTATPFTSVSYQPVPGWSAEIVTATLPNPVEVNGSTVTEAPATVVWTAEEGISITEGQFQQFVVSAGPVPDVGSVSLPTRQTYSDGSVVAWDDEAAEGTEAEHPAPVLYINDTPAADGHSHSDESDTVVTSEPTSPTESDSALPALWVAFGGLALGAVALVVAVFAAVRRKSETQ